MEVDTLSSASRPEKCRSFDQHHEMTLSLNTEYGKNETYVH
jgi:hypothetical protein